MGVASSRPGSRVRSRIETLVALASRLFRERGYHGVGMRTLAEAADMQAASLYHYFRNKEELLLEAHHNIEKEGGGEHVWWVDLMFFVGFLGAFLIQKAIDAAD